VRYLFIAGAIPFLLLGILHIVYTFMDDEHPRRIVPRDRELTERMRTATLVLTRETTVWRAWIGFNLSHGLGIVVFAGAVTYGAAFHFEAVRRAAPELLYAASAIALLYLLMSLRYWFRIPAIGSAIGAALLLAGAIMATV
jgi:hypothetical protein